MTHFLAQDCYDDVAPRVWRSDQHQSPAGSSGWQVASFDRTGVIAWSWFDSNPASHCTEGIEQTFATFLESGPPAGLVVAAPVLAEMRAHLLARCSGSSTFVTLEVALPVRAEVAVWWAVDGVTAAPAAIAGPAYAGAGSWTEVSGRAFLVAPGERRVTAQLSLVANGQRADAKFERVVVVERGQQRALELRVDFGPDGAMRVAGGVD